MMGSLVCWPMSSFIYYFMHGLGGWVRRNNYGLIGAAILRDRGPILREERRERWEAAKGAFTSWRATPPCRRVVNALTLCDRDVRCINTYLLTYLLKWPFLYIFQAWTTQGSSSERLPRSGHCVDILLSTARHLGTCHVISGRYNSLLIYSIATQNYSYTASCWRNPWMEPQWRKKYKAWG